METQPILIILFIYLALFINTLISEFFLMIGSEQFNAIPFNMIDGQIALFKIGVIKTLLFIFGKLASCYISWKLILDGWKWTFDMIGINSSNSNNIVQSMVTNLERKSFV